MRYLHIFICLLAITGGYACQQSTEKEGNAFVVTGEIKGLTEDLYFTYPNRTYSQEARYDTIKVLDGKFHLEDTVSEVLLISAWSKDKRLRKSTPQGFYPTKSSQLMFFVFPGAEVHIQGEISDFVDAYPSGDEHNESLAAINQVMYPLYNQRVNCLVKSSYEEDKAQAAVLQQQADSLNQLSIATLIDQLEDRSSTLGAVWYLGDMMMRRQVDDSSALKLFAQLSLDDEDNSYYQQLAFRVGGIKATQEGMEVPTIVTTSTLNADSFDIATLKGKYVLLDFWGTWCHPCVDEMPQVMAFQKKYKEQLTVVGINSGDSRERVQQFVKEAGYDWQQLLSKKDDSSDNFVNRFNVTGFPTKIILDPEGKIVKRYLGSGEEAFELLEKLLNESRS